MKTFQPDWLLFIERFLISRRQIYVGAVIWTGRSTTPRVGHRGQHQQRYAYQGSNILWNLFINVWLYSPVPKCFRPFMNQVLRTISSTTRALPPMTVIRTRSRGGGGGVRVQTQLQSHGWRGSPGQNTVTSLFSAWNSETRLQVQGVSNKC